MKRKHRTSLHKKLNLHFDFNWLNNPIIVLDEHISSDAEARVFLFLFGRMERGYGLLRPIRPARAILREEGIDETQT